MTDRIRLPAVLAAIALILTACGGSSGGDASATTVADASDTTPTTETTPEPLGTLRIHHPDTLAFAGPFDLITDDGPLSTVADEIVTDVWTTPDVLRSLAVDGRSDVLAVPTDVAANLHDKEVDVHLAAVLVWGLLHVIGPDGTPATWESLRGETVMVPFQNDMPDLIFRHLAEANGLVPGEDVEIEYLATPPEAVIRLVTGRGSFAVLPEHVVTLAIERAGDAGHPLDRILDLQEAWVETTGEGSRIPQAGIVVSGELAGRPDVLAALLDELEADVELMNSLDPDAIEQLADRFDLSEEMVTALIPRLNLEVVPAAEARADLERFYGELAGSAPELIGGSLPGDDFYLADPR